MQPISGNLYKSYLKNDIDDESGIDEIYETTISSDERMQEPHEFYCYNGYRKVIYESINDEPFDVSDIIIRYLSY